MCFCVSNMMQRHKYKVPIWSYFLLLDVRRHAPNQKMTYIQKDLNLQPCVCVCDMLPCETLQLANSLLLLFTYLIENTNNVTNDNGIDVDILNKV